MNDEGMTIVAPSGPSWPADALDEVSELARELVDAYNDGDADRFASLFATDAEFVTIFATRMRGREMIAAGHREAFRTRLAGTALHVIEQNCACINELTVILRLAWNLVHTPRATTTSLQPCKGVLTLVAARRTVNSVPVLVGAANVRSAPIVT